MLFGRSGFPWNRSVGLYITDEVVEVAEVVSVFGRKRVTSLGEKQLQEGIVQNGRIKNEAALTEALREAFSNARPHPIHVKSIIFGLPESQVYIHTFSAYPHALNERRELVLEQIRKQISAPEDSLLFTYRTIPRYRGGSKRANKKDVEIIVAATTRDVISEWKGFFNKLHINVEIFDIEPLATFRGLFIKPPASPVCIIDVRDDKTIISVFDRSGIRYISAVAATSDALSKMVEHVLPETAKEDGSLEALSSLKSEHIKVASLPHKTVELLLKEVEAARSYINDTTGNDISEVIFVGDAEKFKVLLKRFRVRLELWVRVGKPALPMKIAEDGEGSVTPEEDEEIPPNRRPSGAVQYIETIGLAFRKWEGGDLGFYLPSEKQKPSYNLSALKEQRRVHRPTFKEWVEGKKESKKAADALVIHHIEITKPLSFRKKIWIGGIASTLVVIVAITLWSFGGGFVFKRDVQRETTPNSKLSDIVVPSDGATDVPLKNVPSGPAILVKETETGWLNVREEPSISSRILKKILPGETYPLIEKGEKWHKIKLPDGREGWVYNYYVQEIE
ncbi:MAG: hypothetical protein A3C80_03250 [Candidatus Ryanbacteria bacterium RIFCSPHIGHO2_02_FULL_45_43]|uniref:SH3b domain-containing protein n=1 Tax=Candidatus Ryanbacteria bacterium RIFCSPHIGHO2_01_45_13 TaxID=1802112 RepID=A0A1G2G0K0_9BACT|nr:MAG: hypothetical protein A2718_03895 [Candidatus Ryanbacteria bacterium RIFCSPHIGHO2_01_FULL_44_130]OGZ43380.1 MAG: hypothetical protein A2W41_03890 [Candidatus Ryanbacteria bacterium RIFCSPHIGHO2_01_45_13]OGZ48987.1 MAG: hypothetical protein A3C80_03250 [Candidatus Ryanbacteria bacterium RIFCSPHIGHO2_02_FULL_45_43]OGZ50987.1 MAG: hypothetical protein A3E55_04515 [Candidatus Ryanbacteria bacterium RIFCSPHIGHO2_12_FULL_44_20]OGZ51525.1 MAG: hypothetical protein A3A17_01545 [Candidatus Ryanba